MVRNWYERVLDPRRPTTVEFDIHPAAGLQTGEGQRDTERVDMRWWKAQKGLDPVWSDGDPSADPPDYVTLRVNACPRTRSSETIC